MRGHQFVGALGPWTDIFGAQQSTEWQRRLRPTKGIHLTFSRQRIPIEKAVVMAVEQRILFVIPRHEMVIVGTTDTDFSGDPYDVEVTPKDVRYVLQALHQYFPAMNLTAKDILSSYAGIRPLVQDLSLIHI